MKKVISVLLMFVFVLILTGCGCSKENKYSVVCSKKTVEGKVSFSERIGADLKNGKIEEVIFEFKFDKESDAKDYLDTIRNAYKNGEVNLDGKTIIVKQKVKEEKVIDKDGFMKIYTKLGYSCK